MDIKRVVESLKDCDCGQAHLVNIKCVAIERGLVHRCAQILHENDFPKNILAVADKNELQASEGILENLEADGIKAKLKLYDDLRVAEEKLVLEVAALAKNHDGILSIGSGSCNDICRRAALLADKEFAIFATAPSMDGFASGTSPITDNNFKMTRPARQPSIIIGDTDILAKAPNILKVAGFGDVLAKYAALADWRISNLLTGEKFCPHIAQLVRENLRRMEKLADNVTSDDPETAGAIMEALVWAGLYMKLADSVRPASGAEHIIAHFWGIKNLENGQESDFHGREVGVATLYISRIYYDIIGRKNIKFTEDMTDWDEVYRVYGEKMRSDIMKMNDPTVTSEVTPESLEANWTKICAIVREEIPEPQALLSLMKRAGAPVTVSEISVDERLGLAGLEFHPYMRHRLTLARLLPMTNIKIDYEKIVDES